MPDYMTLMGSEDVSRAGYTMREAAHEMQRAASNISEALHSQRLFMDDWLQRLEAVFQNASGGLDPRTPDYGVAP